MVDRLGSDYRRWNDALAARYFNSDSAGQPVYLFVTPDVVSEVGAAFGQGFDDFIEAVRAGPSGATRAGHCQRALQALSGWRERNLTYPPYLAYLGLFVLAGGHDGDFDPRSYYPRLWELLGETETGTPPSFERMWELWQDLEQWSVYDRHGDLGLFEFRILGGKDHIGLPLAQTVLTEGERRALPSIFGDARLEAGSLPSDRELRRALTVHGRSRLRAQTLNQLERGTSGFPDALLEIVSDDFLDWDGEATEDTSVDGTRRTFSAGLRVCLSVDRVSRHGTATLRCRSVRDLPDDGLILTSDAFAEPVACNAFLPGWSQVIKESGKASPVTLPDNAWRNGLALVDDEHGWNLRLRPAPVRVFVDGGSEQLPGLVEVLELPRGAAFYLAFPEASWPKLQPWIESSCDGWQPIELSSPLPVGWMFGSVARATTDEGPRALDGAIGFPDRRTLRFVDGIRAMVGKGNTFFNFAPPKVVLDGAMPGDRVFCRGSELLASDESPYSYELPTALPVDVRVGLEVHSGEDILKHRSLYLVSGSPWLLDAPLVASDGFGRAVDGIAGIAGADVKEPTGRQFVFDPLRTPGLDGRAPRVYFVGRCSGQIVSWPADPLPEWEPVWAIPFGRRGRVLYCGTSMDTDIPLAKQCGDRLHARLWHHILWQSRKRITPPPDREEKALWRRYVEVARG